MVKRRTTVKKPRRGKVVPQVLKETESCRILLVGIGGAGNSIIDRLSETTFGAARCVAVDTDWQQLNAVRNADKVLIGEKSTHRLGPDGAPKVGRVAVEESRQLIEQMLNNIDVVFIIVGLGGDTGTVAAPIVAEVAREKGAVVVGVVTARLGIENQRLGHVAFSLSEMRRVCDTVVVIDNNRFFESVPHLPPNEAFKVMDQVLANMIRGVIETISTPSMISLDISDFKTIVRRGRVAVVGVGESDSSNRAEEAVRNALRSPLINAGCAGATGALINVCGDNQMTIEEANRVGEIVTEMMGHNAMIKLGARAVPNTDGFLKVTLVMTGVDCPRMTSWSDIMMPKLYDIESSYPEPEEGLPVDLSLDQIENFEE